MDTFAPNAQQQQQQQVAANQEILHARIEELFRVKDAKTSNPKEVTVEEQQRVSIEQNMRKDITHIMQALNMQFYKYNGRYLVLETKKSDLKLTDEMRNQVYERFHSSAEVAALPLADRGMTFWSFYDQTIASNGKTRVSLKVTDDAPPEVALAERLGLQ